MASSIDHNMESAGKGSDTATTCSTERDSFVTGTPSPPCDDDDIDSRQVQVINEEFRNLPTSLSHRHAMPDTPFTRRGLLKKKASSSSLLKSFTSRRGGTGSIAALEKEEDDASSGTNSSAAEGFPDNPPQSLSSHQLYNGGTLPRRRNPKPKKSSGMFRSFSKKKQDGKMNFATNHSSHPTPLSNLAEEDDTPELRRNSTHDTALTNLVQANSGDGLMSAADVGRMLQENIDNNEGSGFAVEPPAFGKMDRRSSAHSSFSSTMSDHIENELDFGMDRLDSHALLENLGDSPSSHELDNVAAIRAKEYIEECLSAEISVLDRKKWDSIPQFTKMDLVVGQHLGKGSFSDAFEVFATIVDEEASPTFESLGSDSADLDKLIRAKFRPNPTDEDRDPDKGLDAEIDAMFGSSVASIHSGARGVIREEEDDLDNEIEAMFGKKEADEDYLDNEIDAMFNSSPKESSNVIPEDDAKQLKEDKVEKPKEFQTRRIQSRTTRRRTTDLGGSVCLGTLQSRSSSKKRQERKVVLAMKCLRPQIRSNAEQFMIGVEDLVHETAMLASLDHPNIVKIHGRAGGGCVSNSFRLGDGFFILLDRLKDTLDDRIQRWKKSMDKKAPPSLSQIKTACAIADAMSYLHSKKIVFRDLKPANVGFDSMGVLKLFDFGFAIGIDEPPRSPSMSSGNSGENEESHLLYDKCGTPRYMAPEVGLEMGYSLPADVYSFGILLWEICALKKPFGNVKSADEFHKIVFEKGARPKLVKHWPQVLKDIITTCWSVSEMERPAMPYVKSILAAHFREASTQHNVGKDNLRKSSIFGRRSTG